MLLYRHVYIAYKAAVLAYLIHNHLPAGAVCIVQRCFEIVVGVTAQNYIYTACFCGKAFVVELVAYVP